MMAESRFAKGSGGTAEQSPIQLKVCRIVRTETGRLR